jgi:hypothetical protein
MDDGHIVSVENNANVQTAAAPKGSADRLLFAGEVA